MKIIALGDIHGRAIWKDILDSETFDRVVFIGDYFDTHEGISAEQQKTNFKEIIAYKKANMDKVVLLFGNHDYHYLRGIQQRYSGYQEWSAVDIQELLEDALKDNLLQMCFAFENVLFSHAGVTKTWSENNFDTKGLLNIETSINLLFKHKINAFGFTAGPYRDNYGDEICQTPIWVRPPSLLRDKLDNWIQVVGHTTQDKICTKDNVVFIDALHVGEYLAIENGVINVKKYEIRQPV